MAAKSCYRAAIDLTDDDDNLAADESHPTFTDDKKSARVDLLSDSSAAKRIGVMRYLKAVLFGRDSL